MRGKLIAFSIAKTWAGEWYTGEHLIVKRFIKLSSKAFRLYIRLVPQWTIAGARKNHNGSGEGRKRLLAPESSSAWLGSRRGLPTCKRREE
jgi:hypothetical protein